MQQAFTYAFRLAVRGLVRSRGTTLVAMLTLGVGLAAAVTVLGFVDAGARALPVPRGNDIVSLELRDGRARRIPAPAPVDQWAPAADVLGAGAVQPVTGTLRHPRFVPRRAFGAAMHATVLPLLEVAPAVGRIPTEDPEDAETVVLGWELYQEFGGDAGVLGEQVTLDDVALTIIGVMPEGFGFPENHGFWTVLPRHETGEIVARLAPGTTREAAAAGLAARLDAFAAGTGLESGPHRVVARRWTTSRDGDGAETVVFAGLGILVLMLLLVCCANVGTLLLVRGTERSTVLAVQGALGASRSSMALQLFMESLLIAIGGGAAGIAGGFFLLRMAEMKLSSHWGYYWMTMEVRAPVLLSALALVLLSALLAGTVPALRASRVDLAGLLNQGRTGGDPRQRRLGRWFLGAQLALSSVGLVAAVFLAGEFAVASRLTERLPLDAVAVAHLTLPDGAYDDVGARADLQERLRAELGRIPGVRAVSISGAIPGGAGPVAVVRTPAGDADGPIRRVPVVPADARLPSMYGMRLVAGRPLSAGDLGADGGVLVTAALARTLYDGAAVGEPIHLRGIHEEGEWAEIVGVVDDWYPAASGAGEERAIVPLARAWRNELYVSLATAGDAATVLGGVRDAVRRVDERIPVEQLQTLRARMEWFGRMMKVIAGFGAFGGLGSALVAAIGLYGVMSYQVRVRRREIGIRMAVGAGRRRIVGEIVRETVRRVLPGLATGIAVAMVAVPLLASRDPDADIPAAIARAAELSAIAAALLLAIGVVAAVEPALRASRLDPQEVLRAD